jgi:flagellar biogenesis protein FliO
MACLAATCSLWAHLAAAQSPAPLIEYRRSDAEAPNPLRGQTVPANPPAANTPSAELAPASATHQPVYRDEHVQVAELQTDIEIGAPSPPAKPAPEPTLPATQAHEPSLPAAVAIEASDDRAPSLRLAPPSTHAHAGSNKDKHTHVSNLVPGSLSKFTSLSTAGGGLAVVVGLFLISTWLVRGSGGAKRSGSLPPEAFALLGRAPLTAQSFAQLLRLGNKLVLVAVAADGAQPLAEVTDPAEVERIIGLCAKSAPHGPSAEFQQVLEQLSREPARGFLGREASSARRRA